VTRHPHKPLTQNPCVTESVVRQSLSTHIRNDAYASSTGYQFPLASSAAPGTADAYGTTTAAYANVNANTTTADAGADRDGTNSATAATSSPSSSTSSAYANRSAATAKSSFPASTA